ncbi:hypothetical protein Ahy_A07g032915 [Arachis hypogaea]|uniref:Uncharacterized protein n=1 Tax=Arachis hypogaea TaxID=3818 RepID=A0A445C7S7_ARAHY|nr:hypothetical protein Ahy_A07g032915 [Arachis hypogaea]
MYDHPWTSYTKIPTETRERWFQKWEFKFIWDTEHNLMIKNIYNHRAAKQLQEMMSDELEAHFRTNKGFKCRRLTNVTNKASPRSSKYMGGSATFKKTKSRLSKSLDHKVTLAETFEYTHTLKANNKRFAHKWSTAYYPSSGNDDPDSNTLVVDPDRVWRETTSEPHKNRPFGWGHFLPAASVPPHWRLYLSLPPSCRSRGSCQLEGGGAEAHTGASPTSSV